MSVDADYVFDAFGPVAVYATGCMAGLCELLTVLTGIVALKSVG